MNILYQIWNVVVPRPVWDFITHAVQHLAIGRLAPHTGYYASIGHLASATDPDAASGVNPRTSADVRKASGAWMFTAHQAILEVLVSGEKYGVEIRDEISRRTSREVGPGSLYPALRTLKDDGLVSSREGEGTAIRGGRPKVYYALTPTGRRAADEARRVMADLYGFTLRSA